LAVTLAECCFDSAADDGTCLSAEAAIDFDEGPAEAAVFGERGGRVVVSVAAGSLARVAAIAAQYKLQATQIGTVTRGAFRIQYRGQAVIHGAIGSFREIWAGSLGKVLAGV
jgi:hypothetical protein